MPFPSGEQASPLPVVVLLSGGGTTLQNLIDCQQRGELNLDIRLVIGSRPSAYGLERAQKHGIASTVIERKGLTAEEFQQRIFSRCREAGAELVVLAGFLQLLPIPDDYLGRVINIHPSLIPAFCGKGYHGEHVHQAVLDRGVKITGCTAHFCDNLYDHGPIILQRAVEVADDDTAATLAARVFEAECLVLPEAIRRFATGRLRIDGSRVRLLSEADAAGSD